MVLSLLLLCSQVGLGQTGLVAYIAGGTQNYSQLSIVDVSTGQSEYIGESALDAFPAWSPDGRCVAYQSRNADGVCIRLAYPREDIPDEALTHQYPVNTDPAWSADGKRLAYISYTDSNPFPLIQVYDFETAQESTWGGDQQGFVSVAWLASTDLMQALNPEDLEDVKTAGLLKLRDEAEKTGVLTAIGVSTDTPPLSTELYVVTPSYSLPLLPLLTTDSSRFVKYGLRPDHKARQIAFESNDGGDREIFVLGRRGIINVSNHPAADWNPVWSPDNNWIIFESFRNGRCGLYSLLVNTGNISPLIVDTAYNCWAADWSPDGKWIVFVSDMDGVPQLYRIRPDGSQLKQLTEAAHAALSPVWQPKTKEMETTAK